jgi:2-oxoglutarate ferredoxin oxidoreductase subunit delta
MAEAEDTNKKCPNADGKTTITIYPAWCKRCGLCSAFCPGNVYDVDEVGRPVVARPEQCKTCYQCELRCPDFAIQVVREEDK